MTPAEVFNGRITKAAQAAAGGPVAAVYQFNITGDGGGEWIVNMGDGTVGEGTDEDAECTITLSAEDFIAMVSGEIAGPQLFMTGRLQVGGNMALAMQLGTLLR